MKFEMKLLFIAVVIGLIVMPGCKNNSASQTTKNFNMGLLPLTCEAKSDTKRGIKMTVILNGGKLNLDINKQSVLIEDVEFLLSSCHDREKMLVPPMEWDKLVKYGSCVHIIYPKPIILTTIAKSNLVLTEILVPINNREWGKMILVRNGEDIYSPFTSFDQKLFYKIEALLFQH
jgi:hypothetical protein